MRTFSPQQIAVMAAGAVVLMILLHLLGVLGAIGGAARWLVFSVAAPIRQSSVALVSDSGLQCTEETLAELEELLLENSKLRTLAAENAALKNALDFSERNEDELVLARVVAESADVTNRGLVIDRGSDDGLQIGQPVTIGSGVIVGKIKNVQRRSATVLLLTDSDSKLAVMVQGGSGVSGLLEGDRGLSMTISLIPQSERISVGDVVVTSGLEKGIRPGLMVGTVDQVRQDSQEPFQTATVIPLQRAEHPVFVQIIVDKGQAS